MTSTAAMEAGSTSVERLLAAAVATMEKARYCWAMTVAEDGSVNARPMGPQKSPASEDPFGILFLTRRGSRRPNSDISPSPRVARDPLLLRMRPPDPHGEDRGNAARPEP